MVQDTVEERIRERAHQIWIEQGKPEGKHREHWERAREEIETDADKRLIEDRKQQA